MRIILEKMTAHEPFWGLVQQSGPWHQTANDKRVLNEKSIDWSGGGIGVGGKDHAGNALWKSITNFDTQRTSFMPAPPPPSKYVTRSIVDNNKPYPRGYLPSMPGFKDFQQNLDEQGSVIAQGLGIMTQMPYMYPRAGVFERNLDLMAAAEPQHTNPMAETDRQATVEAKSEEYVDAMAAGTYHSGGVMRESQVSRAEENIIHLGDDDGQGGMHVASIFVPPTPDIVEQALGGIKELDHIAGPVPVQQDDITPAEHLGRIGGDFADRRDSLKKNMGKYGGSSGNVQQLNTVPADTPPGDGRSSNARLEKKVDEILPKLRKKLKEGDPAKKRKRDDAGEGKVGKKSSRNSYYSRRDVASSN